LIDHLQRFTLPAAYALLPPRLASPAASALLLAIGLQESRFLYRRQLEGGPARGFWMFERGGGIVGVLTHPAVKDHLEDALIDLRYEGAIGNPTYCHALVEDNDVLACVFARLLLWTLPGDLPGRDDPTGGWRQYLEAWRPGKPHRETWTAFYAEAWSRVEASRADDS